MTILEYTWIKNHLCSLIGYPHSQTILFWRTGNLDAAIPLEHSCCSESVWGSMNKRKLPLFVKNNSDYLDFSHHKRTTRLIA
jgi:hypothetical protein